MENAKTRSLFLISCLVLLLLVGTIWFLVGPSVMGMSTTTLVLPSVSVAVAEVQVINGVAGLTPLPAEIQTQLDALTLSASQLVSAFDIGSAKIEGATMSIRVTKDEFGHCTFSSWINHPNASNSLFRNMRFSHRFDDCDPLAMARYFVMILNDLVKVGFSADLLQKLANGVVVELVKNLVSPQNFDVFMGFFNKAFAVIFTG